MLDLSRNRTWEAIDPPQWRSEGGGGGDICPRAQGFR